MTRAVSIHIGLNKLTYSHYNGTEFGDLESCEKDVDDMERIAEHHHFTEQTKLKTEQAKKDVVISEIKKYTKNGNYALNTDDFLLITFSGHGARKKSGEYNNYDEGWCLYDKIVFDDELVDLLTDFNEDVRILIISDSCFSGGVIDYPKMGITREVKLLLENKGFDFCNFENKLLVEMGYDFADYDRKIWEKNRQILYRKAIKDNLTFNLEKLDQLELLELIETEVKNLPIGLVKHLYRKDQDYYDSELNTARESLINKFGKKTNDEYLRSGKATVLLLAACKEDQLTFARKNANQNSEFTDSFKKIWNNGNFTESNYSQFIASILIEVQKIRRTQIPIFTPKGKKNPAFENRKPFLI